MRRSKCEQPNKNIQKEIEKRKRKCQKKEKNFNVYKKIILFNPFCSSPSIINQVYKYRMERKLLDFDPHIYDGGGATFQKKIKTL